MSYEYQMGFGQDNGASSPVPTNGNGITTNGGNAPTSPDPSQGPVIRVGEGTEVHLEGLIMLGLAGAFFWWFFKQFMPRMKAAAERERAADAGGT